MMAIVCLASINISNADAKTRKRSPQARRTTVNIACSNLSGSAQNVYDNRVPLTNYYFSFNGSTGTLKRISDVQPLNYVVKLVSLRGNKLILKVKFDDCDWEEGRMEGTVTVVNGQITQYKGKLIWDVGMGGTDVEKFNLSTSEN